MCEPSHFLICKITAFSSSICLLANLFYKRSSYYTDLKLPNSCIQPVSVYLTARDNRCANTGNRKWQLYCIYYNSIRIFISHGSSSKKLVGPLKITLNLWQSLRSVIIISLLSLLIHTCIINLCEFKYFLFYNAF